MSDSATEAPLTRLGKVESTVLTLLQEVHALRADLQKQSNGGPETLLDAEAVATILNVDVGYVHSMARTGKIPSVKVGKYRKFIPSHLKKWLDRENSRKST